MQGQWRREFDKIARNGITNFAALYKKRPEEVALLLLLDSQGRATVYTKIRGGESRQVQFKQVIHKPDTKMDLTGKAIFLPVVIGKQMTRLCERYELDPVVMNVEIRYSEGDIYLFLMNGTQKVTMLREGDIFDEEQTSVDALKAQQELV